MFSFALQIGKVGEFRGEGTCIPVRKILEYVLFHACCVHLEFHIKLFAFCYTKLEEACSKIQALLTSSLNVLSHTFKRLVRLPKFGNKPMSRFSDQMTSALAE